MNLIAPPDCRRRSLSGRGGFVPSIIGPVIISPAIISPAIIGPTVISPAIIGPPGYRAAALRLLEIFLARRALSFCTAVICG